VPTIGGRRLFNPSPLATWLVASLLGIAVILVMGRVGWIRTGALSGLVDLGVRVLALVFLLRAVGNLRSFGFFKTITDTPFAEWDTWLYSPLCLLLAMLAAGLVWLVR